MKLGVTSLICWHNSQFKKKWPLAGWGLRLCEESESVQGGSVIHEDGGGRSQLLQSAVHVPLAALSGPGATLQAKFPQVLLEVLVVHGPVGLWFTQRLCRRRNKSEKSSLYSVTDPDPRSVSRRWTVAWMCLTEQIIENQPGNVGRSLCIRPWGRTARGSGVWDICSFRGPSPWRGGTFEGRAPTRTRSGRWWQFVFPGRMGRWGCSEESSPLVLLDASSLLPEKTMITVTDGLSALRCLILPQNLIYRSHS